MAKIGYQVPPDENRCTATSKQTGERCRRPRCNGTTKCRYHGGNSPRGAAHYKTGEKITPLVHKQLPKYSKVLPDRLLERYQAGREDSELLAMREELLVMDSRLADLISRVESGESGELWKKIKKSFEDFSAALKAGDSDEIARNLSEMQRLITRGQGDYQTWREVSNVIEQRRKLVESERKRMLEMQQFLSVEQGMTMVLSVAGIVKRYITDPEQLASVSNELASILTLENGMIVGNPELSSSRAS